MKKYQIGDLIFFKSYGSKIEKLIQFFTRSEYVHVACVISREGTIIEASHDGVKTRVFPVSWLNEKTTVMRHKYATPFQLSRAVDFMIKQKGKGYDFLGLVGIAWSLIFKTKGNALDGKNRFWCSELVADGFNSAGLACGASKKSFKVSPADLMKSGYFVEVSL